MGVEAAFEIVAVSSRGKFDEIRSSHSQHLSVDSELLRQILRIHPVMGSYAF